MKKYFQLNVLLVSTVLTVSFLVGSKSSIDVMKNDEMKKKYHVHIVDPTKPITVFSHGIQENHEQGIRYKSFFCKEFNYEESNCIFFDYPDAPEGLPGRNHNTGLAQNSEMTALSYAVGISF